MNYTQAAASLVTRARLGDQNAMGTIAAVADAAKERLNLRAGITARCIDRYIQKNPHPDFDAPQDKPSAEEHVDVLHLRGLSHVDTFLRCCQRVLEAKNGFWVVCAVLAAGPKLTQDRVDSYLDGGAFAVPVAMEIIDTSKRWQAVRDRRVPIKLVSDDAAWELGE